MSEQAVIVRFRYGSEDLGNLHALEDQIAQALREAGEGELDGHDITPDLKEATIYIYAPDAEFAFVVAQQVLEYADCVHDAVATVRYGPPKDGVEERIVHLTRRST